MKKMFIGKYINTHGIKGEIKISSDIDHKEQIFKKGNILFIGEKKFTISQYRVHKNLDMITFEEINNINEILELKGKNVFIDRDSLDKDIIFYDDLIDKKLIIDGKIVGKVLDYENTNNPLLICLIDNKKVLIPLKGNFIDNMNEDQINLNKMAKELII